MHRRWLGLALLATFALGVSAPARPADRRVGHDRPRSPRTFLLAPPSSEDVAGASSRGGPSRASSRRFEKQKDHAFWARGARGLLVRADPLGVEVSAPCRTAVGCRVSLRLVAFGRDRLLDRVPSGRPFPQGDRIELERDGLTEWYLSGETGIEQGFRLERPPSGRRRSNPAVLEMALAVEGDVMMGPDGDSILFQDVLGETFMEYSHLRVFDATGREISARLALAGEDRLQIRIDDEDAAYPLTVDPLFIPAGAALSGEATNDYFGSSVAGAGDVNGDGYADVLVGAPGHDNGEFRFGRAYLYLGSPDGIGSIPSWVAEGTDVGYGFAGNIAGAGDLNGDGFDDVVVSGVGRAHVYFGATSGLSSSPDWTSEAQDPGIGFGFGLAVGGAGDVNGDGFSDVLVGAPQQSIGAPSPGQASLYLGSASGPEARPAWTLDGEQPGAAFGYSVAAAGDVNGDGYGDVIIGEPGYDYPDPIDRPNAGKVVVFLGSASGLATSPAWESRLVNRFAFLGSSVDSAGDVNGDGYADLLIGGFNGFGAERGVAQVYLGSTSGPLSDPAWTQTGDHSLSHFGTSVAGGGDLNGDGYADVVVGEPDYDRSFEEESVGRAYVYRGSVSGLSGTAAGFAEGDVAFALLGYSVAGAGDVNGDGLDDLLAGAPALGQVQGIGNVYVYVSAPDDRPPVPRIAAPQTVECASPSGAAVALDGSGSTDPDSSPGTHDDIQAFEWFESYGQPSAVLLGTGETLSVPLSLGTHPVTLRVTDRAGASAIETVTIKVADTVPPQLTLLLSPAVLWPPNHRMIAVHATVAVTDACGSAAATLASVSSNEPDNAPGSADGDTVNDSQGVSPGTPDFDFLLRAERLDSGSGRVYTIVYGATDAAGNPATLVGQVNVPASLTRRAPSFSRMLQPDKRASAIGHDPKPSSRLKP